MNMNNKNSLDRQPVISLKNIGLSYTANKKSKYDALTDINLDIYKNDFVCVLGKSGCGKSTLLNIIAGFLMPTKGTAEILGSPIKGPDKNRAVVFQNATLYPWLSTYDNIAFGLKMRKLPAEQIRQTTEKYMKSVGLSDFADNKPYELSGGMRQRAALARALSNEPEIILMDEPFGALDALTRVKMQELVRGIRKENGNTMFMITHDVDEAMTLANRIIILSDRPGTIVRTFDIDFCDRIKNAGDDDIKYSEEYRLIRNEILDIINED